MATETKSAPTFQLSKGTVFSLAKLKAGVDSFYIGLNWDPATDGADIDLDAVLVAVGDDGKVAKGKETESFLFYDNNGRGNNPPTAYNLSEDNRTGKDNGDDDDESINIFTDLLTPDVSKIKIFITFHESGGLSLSDVNDVSLLVCPLVDGEPDRSSEHSALFTVEDIKDSLGAHMADIVPNPAGGWDLVAIGKGCGNLREVAEAHGIQTEG